MAEILLKISDGSNYADGDVLCAFNNRFIRCTHAQHLCYPHDGPHWSNLERNGLIAADSLTFDAQEAIRETRLERLGRHEARQVRIATGESVTFRSNEQFVDLFGKTVSMHIPSYFERRVKTLHSDKTTGIPVFGSPGREIVHGGKNDFSDTALDTVWDAIENRTGQLRTEDEFQLWPMGRLDIRHHLAVRVVDFSDEEAQGLVSPQYELDGDGNQVLGDDGQPIVLAKRNINVDWVNVLLDDLGVTEAQVRDRDFAVGREVQIPPGRLRFESKPQPVQSDRGKLHNKSLGGPVQ